MSVKQMTTQQIRDDLDSVALTWPDGVPQQQADRVNALNRELKRRGEEPWVAGVSRPATRPTQPPNSMTVESLEQELRELSNRIGRAPDDEASQRRFADVRFELRRRAKVEDYATDPKAQTPGTVAAEYSKSSPPLPPRALELPTDDEMIMKEAVKARVSAPKLSVLQGLQVDVCGYTASAAGAGGRPVVLSHTLHSELGSMITSSSFTLDETVAFIKMLQGALAAAISKLNG